MLSPWKDFDRIGARRTPHFELGRRRELAERTLEIAIIVDARPVRGEDPVAGSKAGATRPASRALSS